MLTPDQEWAIVHALLAGESFRNVATLHQCHISTVKSVFRYFEETGTVSGRVHIHREGSLSVIVEALRRGYPWLYLDEYARYIRAAGIKMSKSTIQRVLVGNNITRKRLSLRAKTANLRQIAAFIVEARRFQTQQFIFLDETDIDEQTFERTHGRSKRGEPVLAPTAFASRAKYTGMGVISWDGLVCYELRRRLRWCQISRVSVHSAVSCG